MAKYVVFSFDDGRLDTYTGAYPVLKRYNMPFTFNVCTDFVQNQSRYDCFRSADNKSVDATHLVEMQQNGVEIACHGHLHLNTREDVQDNIAALRDMGVDVNAIGFASPNSEITENNAEDVFQMIRDGELSYIRSGIQVRREGLLYSALSVLERKTHSPLLFYLLNKRCIVKDRTRRFLLSVGIHKGVTNKQILNLISKMKDGEGVILMFHSVLDKHDIGFGRDNWFFDLERFDRLCRELSEKSDIAVCTTKELML